MISGDSSTEENSFIDSQILWCLMVLGFILIALDWAISDF